MKEKNSSTQKALNLWAVVLIVWSIYRSQLKLPEWFDEFVAKPLVFIIPVYLYIRKVDKKNFFESMDLKVRSLPIDAIMGVAIGLVFALTAILANYIKLHKLIIIKGGVMSGNVMYVFVLAMATAISEEILSRGFVLKKLYDESKNIYTSSFFASILFFFLHVPILFTNLKINGNLLLVFIVTDLILSLVNSFILIERKSLFLPIFIHALYNFSITLFI